MQSEGLNMARDRESFDYDPFGRTALLVGLIVFIVLLVFEPQLLDQWGNSALTAVEAHIPWR